MTRFRAVCACQQARYAVHTRAAARTRVLDALFESARQGGIAARPAGLGGWRGGCTARQWYILVSKRVLVAYKRYRY